MRTIASVIALVMVVGCGGGVLPVDGPFDPDAGHAFDTGLGSGTGTGVSTGIIFTTGTTTGLTTTATTGVTTTTTGNTTTTTTGNTTTTTTGTTATTTSTTATTETTTTSTTTTSSSSSSSGGTPTWTELYTDYLAVGTIGNCDGSCHHHSQCSSPSSCYSWIGNKQLSGGGGLLSWDNGYMPPSGPSSNTAAEDAFTAWTAAGSPDN